MLISIIIKYIGLLISIPDPGTYTGGSGEGSK
jgi:hypothetical protein